MTGAEPGKTEPGRPQPPVTPISERFWEATRKRVYLLQWCQGCDRPIHFPRVACPWCSGSDLEWRPASGRGRIYSFTVEHRPAHPSFGPDPYVVALVDLDEGARVMTNIVGCPPEAIQIGQAVEVVWEPLDDGRNLALFTAADQTKLTAP